MDHATGVRGVAPEPNRRAVLVYSPSSGTSESVERIVAALEQFAMRVDETVDVSTLGDERRGPAWEASGVGTVIAAGGDGTVGSVATHIAGTGLSLGILPLGTGNNAARSLGIPLDLEGAAAVFSTGEVVAIDVGEVVDERGKVARFLHAAMLGWNAEFARIVTDEDRRERLGALNYPLAVVETLMSTTPLRATIVFSDGTTIEDTVQIAAMNLPHMLGSAIPIRVPGVDASDGRLSFFIAKSLTDIQRVEARSARIRTDEPADVSVDGEPCLKTPVEIRTPAEPLRVWRPVG